MCAANKRQTSRKSLDAAAVGLFGAQSTFANPTSGRPIASWSVSITTQDESDAQLMADTFVIAVASVCDEGASMNQSCNTGKRTKNMLGDAAGHFSRLSTTLALTASDRPSASWSVSTTTQDGPYT